MAVTAPPQTCVSTGPVAHCAAMSGPFFAAAAAWKVAMNVSVACGTTLIEMFGWAASYAFTASPMASFAPGASSLPQNQKVRSTFSLLAAALVAPPAAAVVPAAELDDPPDDPPQAARTRPASTARTPIQPDFARAVEARMVLLLTRPAITPLLKRLAIPPGSRIMALRRRWCKRAGPRLRTWA